MNADLKHSIGFDRSGRLSDHSQPFGDPWAPFWTPTVASEQKVPLDPVWGGPPAHHITAPVNVFLYSEVR